VRRGGLAWSLAGGVAAGALVASAAAGALAADITFEPAVGSRVLFTDNVDLTSENEEAGVVGQLNYFSDVQVEGRRFDFRLRGNLTVETVNGETPSIDQDVRATADAELIEELLFLDARASSTRSVVDSRTRVSGATGGNDDNTATVNTYSLSPYVLQSFGDWVDAEARVRLQETRTTGQEDDEEGDGENEARRETQQTLTFSGGDAFGRIGWGVELDRETSKAIDADAGDAEFTRTQGSVEGSYAFTHSIRGLARVGYVDVDTGADDGQDLSGALWDFGVELDSARGTFTARAGQRFNEPWVSFAVDYALTPRLTVLGSLERRVDTTLGAVARDRSGDPLDTGLRGTVETTESGEDIDRDGVALVYSGDLGLYGDYGRNSLALVGRYTQRDFADSTETRYAANFNWGRALSRDWRTNLNLEGIQVEDEDQDTLQTVSGTARITHDLAENAQVFGGVTRTQRFADDPNEEYTENVIFLGGRISF
jgi:uncharacterized protein (PEP-CTERM system associated)